MMMRRAPVLRASPAIALALALQSIFTVFGQPNPANRPPAAAFAESRFAPALERIWTVLNEEQRASLRQAMENQREKVRDLEIQSRQLRRDLFELGLKEKFDEDSVRAKALEAAKADAELAVIRAQAFSRMRPALTADQIQKLKAGFAAERPDGRPDSSRRRPESERDEHGLPPKKRAEAQEQSPKPNQP
jgi:Spy/CpxP family protein refolding chaperone